MLAGCSSFKGNTPDGSGSDGEDDPKEYAIFVTPTENGEFVARVNDIAVEVACEGDLVVLTATPARGYEFTEWRTTGVTLAVPTANPALFTMPAGDVVVEAVFELRSAAEFYDITITASEGGSAVARVGGEEVSRAFEGDEVVLTAIPDEGYEFSAWVVEGVEFISPTANPSAFTMPAGNVTVGAEFTPLSDIVMDGVEINGVRWATRNVDAAGTFAAKRTDAGGYFTFEQASSVCPEGWRPPTAAEFETLFDDDKVTAEWVEATAEITSEAASGSSAGMLLIDKTTGNSIFLPAAGVFVGDGNTLSHIGNGFYWSGTETGSETGYFLQIYSAGAICESGLRGDGLTVRPVADSKQSLNPCRNR